MSLGWTSLGQKYPETGSLLLFRSGQAPSLCDLKWRETQLPKTSHSAEPKRNLPQKPRYSLACPVIECLLALFGLSRTGFPLAFHLGVCMDSTREQPQTPVNTQLFGSRRRERGAPSSSDCSTTMASPFEFRSPHHHLPADWSDTDQHIIESLLLPDENWTPPSVDLPRKRVDPFFDGADSKGHAVTQPVSRTTPTAGGAQGREAAVTKKKRASRKRVSVEEKRMKHREVQRRFMQRKKVRRH